jgi:preprotein translocase subunit SecG
MERILLAIHVLLALGIIVTVLLQRSEGGGLGIGGSGNAGMMSARGTANLLTRTTAVLAACFMLTSLGLALLAGSHATPSSIIDQPAGGTPAASEPAAPADQAPAKEEPQAPQAPVSD